MADCYIERFVQAYVLDKANERVELHFRRDITVRHVTRKGSILLAVFWVKVLQHPNNYPVSKYVYKDIYHNGSGADLLQVKVEDGVQFTVAMANGTLKIEGPDVYYWFKYNFMELLKRYSAVSWELPAQAVDTQHLQTGKRKKEAHFTDERTQVEEYLQQMSHRHGLDGISAIKPEEDLRSEELIHGMEDITVSQLCVWTEEKLEERMQEYSTSSIQDGFTSVYRMWKSLLHRWFGEGSRVYIATPLLDTQRLKDIADIFILSRRHANIEAIYLPRDSKTLPAKQLLSLRRDVALEYSDKFHPVIDYMIFRRITHPWKGFNVNFIAGVKDDKAEVLLTSACFHADHFTTDKMQMVMFETMKETDFMTKYVNPITGGSS